MTETPDPRPRRASVPAILLRLAGFVAVVLVLHRGMDWALARAAASAHADMMTLGVIAALLLAYAALIAIPFVPGIEIGLALLALRGAEIAPFVYAATLAGLSIAYLAGRRIPLDRIERGFAGIGMHRAADSVAALKPLSERRRLALLRARMPAFLADTAVRWRYVMLGLLLNLPGNAILGGGGGICLVAGLSGVYAPRATVLTLALAIAPLPLLAWLTGFDPATLIGAG